MHMQFNVSFRRAINIVTSNIVRSLVEVDC